MEENSHRIISSFSATTGERYNDLFKKYLSLLQRVRSTWSLLSLDFAGYVELCPKQQSRKR